MPKFQEHFILVCNAVLTDGNLPALFWNLLPSYTLTVAVYVPTVLVNTYLRGCTASHDRKWYYSYSST